MTSNGDVIDNVLMGKQWLGSLDDGPQCIRGSANMMYNTVYNSTSKWCTPNIMKGCDRIMFCIIKAQDDGVNFVPRGSGQNSGSE